MNKIPIQAINNMMDRRIAYFFDEGIDMERIARRIGRPHDIERIKEALKRTGR